MSRSISSLLILLAVLPAAGAALASNGEGQLVVLGGLPFEFSPASCVGDRIAASAESLIVAVDGRIVFSGAAGGPAGDRIRIDPLPVGTHTVTVDADGTSCTRRVRAIPGILSILPPVVAILFALLFKQVVLALLAGVWLGAFFLGGFNPFTAFLRIVDGFVIETLAGAEEGRDHISIIVFTLLLGGMVGITSRMGGMRGIVDRVSRIATSPKRGQLAVWLMGVIIFFDDYTNTLIVGNSTRPLTDRLRISREKLSYIVDSTAAPITSLAVITSWIGFQISLINQAFVAMEIHRNPLATLVSSLPYSFYPIFAILFVLFVILTGRDFSLMLAAERRARLTGKVSGDTAIPLSNIDSEATAPAAGAEPRMHNGVIPVLLVILVSFAGLVYTGREALVRSGIEHPALLDALKESNSFTALLWGSFAGCLTAALLALGQRLLTLTETVASWVDGIRSMLTAIIILVLAWCIGMVCVRLNTADYLVHHLSGVLSPHLLPTIVYVLAMGISFSTGTSWGTMSILTPIVIPLVYGTADAAGIAGGDLDRMLFASIAAILSGAVFGDHCSPISDTTIMSSMASAADHIDHVRTQLPYALSAGAVALIFGYMMTAMGLHVALSLVAGSAALAIILRIAGRPVGEAPGGE